MSIGAVDNAIRRIRVVVKEWDDAELPHWREDQTRYGVIDPVIRALGWNISDPKECHPEYPRPYREGRVDYALFGIPDVEAIGNNSMAPDIVLESKAFRIPLDDEAVSQLESYVRAEPRMRGGVAVLTNGSEWRIYDVSRRGGFAGKEVARLDILTGNRRNSARLLSQWLSRLELG